MYAFLMALTVFQHFESFMVRIDVNFSHSDVIIRHDVVGSPITKPRLVLRGHSRLIAIGTD